MIFTCMSECEKMCENFLKIFSTFIGEKLSAKIKGVKSAIAAEIKKPKPNEFILHMPEIYFLLKNLRIIGWK